MVHVNIIYKCKRDSLQKNFLSLNECDVDDKTTISVTLVVFWGGFCWCVSSCDPQPGPGLIHAEPCVAGPWPSVWKVSPGPPSSQLVSTSSSRVKMTTTRMWPKSSGSLETVRARYWCPPSSSWCGDHGSVAALQRQGSRRRRRFSGSSACPKCR